MAGAVAHSVIEAPPVLFHVEVELPLRAQVTISDEKLASIIIERTSSGALPKRDHVLCPEWLPGLLPS